eukprot:999872_1
MFCSASKSIYFIMLALLYLYLFIFRCWHSRDMTHDENMKIYFYCNHCDKIRYSNNSNRIVHRCTNHSNENKIESIRVKLYTPIGTTAQTKVGDCTRHHKKEIKHCIVPPEDYQNILSDEIKQAKLDFSRKNKTESNESKMPMDVDDIVDHHLVQKVSVFADDTTTNLFTNLQKKHQTLSTVMPALITNTGLPENVIKNKWKKQKIQTPSDNTLEKVDDDSHDTYQYKYEIIYTKPLPSIYEFI